MAELYKEIEITCPICQMVKLVKIPEAVFSQKKFGSVKVQIPPGAVCNEHQFITFIDTKGIIRGYEKIDILMGDSEETKEDVEGKVSLRQLIEIFGLYGVFSLLHASLFRYPAYILKDDKFEDVSNQIIKLFERFRPKNYTDSSYIKYLEETDYGKIKLKEKNALLIDSNKNMVLQTPWDHKLKFEESIIKKALEIIDNEEQIILIEQDIAHFVEEAEKAKEILENEDLEVIAEKNLVKQLMTELKIPKINKYRMALIKEFISQWFSTKLTKKMKSKLQGFLNLL
jgi:hypothetical protein